MVNKKIKKIIGGMLILSLIVPNMSVSAIDSNLIENKSNVESNVLQEEIHESYNEEVIKNEDISQNDDTHISQDKSINENIENVDDNNKQTTSEELTKHTEESDIIQESDIVQVSESNTTDESNIGEIVGTKYEVEVLHMPVPINIDTFEREEFKLKFSNLEGFQNLKNKTDAKYEITLAHSDGSYSFLDTANTLEEAKEKSKNISDKEKSSNDSMVAIVDENGQVVYSDFSIARIYKHINGKPYPNRDKNANVYKDKELKNVHTYINHGYVEDAPIIETFQNKSAKVLMSGYEGWLKMDKNSSEYDMLVVPVNQVINPSRYFVKDGVLKHFISSNVVSGTSGHTIDLGKAPEFLKEGTRYFSYDGEYFYDGTNIANGMVNLITDLREDSKARAVNSRAPYHNYYQNLPFRTKTVFTAEELNEFIVENTLATSKLRGTGQALKNAEEKFGINALIMLGVAINESAWGMSAIAQSKNNIFGLNAVDSAPGLAANEFASVAACINDFAKNWISGGYSDPADWRYYGGFVGDKSLGLNVKYASDPYWGEKATKYAFMADLQLSGNVNSLQDTDKYKVGIFIGTDEVTDASGNLLYKVSDNFNDHASYVGTTFALSKQEKVDVNGEECYEINPEISAPLHSSGALNNFDGNYNWNFKGYVDSDNVKMINEVENFKPQLEVIGGENRYETAEKLSRSIYNNSEYVVIVNSTAIIDGITSSALASGVGAPILLSTKDYITQSTKEEIVRLNAKKVLLVGGEGVLSSGIVNDLNNLGIYDITRVGGQNRYETALSIAQYIDTNLYDVNSIFLVNGLGESDALSAGSISGEKKMPILLTESTKITSIVKNWISTENLNNAYVIGGQGVISTQVLEELNTFTENNLSGEENRLGGKNRYETNSIILEKFYPRILNSIYVSKGDVLVDALTAGPIAAKNDSPIVLVAQSLTMEQKTALLKKGTKKIIQAGLGISPNVIEEIREFTAM